MLHFHLNQAGLGTACVNHQGGSFTMWSLSKWSLIYIYNLKGVGSQLFVNIQMACKSWHCTNKVMKEKIDDFLICFNNEMVLCSLKSILSVVNNNICVALSCKLLISSSSIRTKDHSKTFYQDNLLESFLDFSLWRGKLFQDWSKSLFFGIKSRNCFFFAET